MVAAEYLQGGLDAITPATEPLKTKPSRASRSRNKQDKNTKGREEEEASEPKGTEGTRKIQVLAKSVLAGTMEMGLVLSSSLGSSVFQRQSGSFSKLSEQWQEGLAAHGDEGDSKRSRSPRRERGKKDSNQKPKKEEDSSHAFSDIDPRTWSPG